MALNEKIKTIIKLNIIINITVYNNNFLIWKFISKLLYRMYNVFVITVSVVRNNDSLDIATNIRKVLMFNEKTILFPYSIVVNLFLAYL